MSNNYRRMRNAAMGAIGGAAARDAYRYGKSLLSYKPKGTWTSRRTERIQRKRPNREYGQHQITSSPRIHTNTPVSLLLDTRDLRQAVVNLIPKRDSTFKIGSRSRDIVNTVGIRTTISFTLSVDDRDALDFACIGINCALIVPRDSSTGSANINNFFRGDQNEDRAYGFNTTRSFLEMHNSPINSDDYAVLWRDKRILSMYNGTSTWNQTKYIPYKRQLRFDDLGEPHENVLLVFWCDDTRAAGFAASRPNAITAQTKTELLFHDVA